MPPSSPPRDLCYDYTGVHVEEDEQEEQSGGCDRGGVTTRIGDLFQAAIPDLAHRAGRNGCGVSRAGFHCSCTSRSHPFDMNVIIGASCVAKFSY